MALTTFNIIIITLCAIIIESNPLKVTCDNRLNTYSVLNDTCYVKEIEQSISNNEKFEFLLSYETPDKILSFDIYTKPDQPSIDHIPTEVFDFFPNLQTLRVNSKVKVILPNDLQKGANLSSLVISDQLEKISKGIFPANSQLESLSLYSNRISEIDDYAFDGLDHLFSLKLQNNEITEIRRNTFVGLPELHVLNLHGNKIQTIEEYSFQLPKLDYLYLDSNKIKTLSDNVFVGLGNLREISLKDNQLNTIHKALYILHNVKTIDLRYNEITDVNQDEFSKLQKLEDLKL